ncbi:MAG: hypothetical protein ACE5JU_21265 [Candidatus Binatia bacterium]
MIRDDKELKVTLDRITHFQQTVQHLRQSEPDSENYKAAAEGYLAEIDKMNLEVREYLASHPKELRTTSSG